MQMNRSFCKFYLSIISHYTIICTHTYVVKFPLVWLMHIICNLHIYTGLCKLQLYTYCLHVHTKKVHMNQLQLAMQYISENLGGAQKDQRLAGVTTQAGNTLRQDENNITRSGDWVLMQTMANDTPCTEWTGREARPNQQLLATVGLQFQPLHEAHWPCCSMEHELYRQFMLLTAGMHWSQAVAGRELEQTPQAHASIRFNISPQRNNADSTLWSRVLREWRSSSLKNIGQRTPGRKDEDMVHTRVDVHVHASASQCTEDDIPYT